MTYAAIVPIDETDVVLPIDLTATNSSLTPNDYRDTETFTGWIERQLRDSGCRYAVGGYNEHRVIYDRSGLFDGAEEPRRLHLGIDIWGPAGTIVMAPLAGSVHSSANNDGFGDYGGTIILEHEINGGRFYTLYGHLTRDAAMRAVAGRQIEQGESFAAFGDPSENGGWPPHLHFQLIIDIGVNRGDYPGVCQFSERHHWLKNSPDPSFLLPAWKMKYK